MSTFLNKPGISFLLFFLFLVVYNCNLHLVVSGGDSLATKVLPLSLLQQGNLYVDQFAPLYLGTVWPIDIPNENRLHSIRFLKGHWLSAYPVVIPMVIAPLYVPLGWFLAHYHIPYNDPLALQLLDLMEKVSASLIASLSALVLFWALCRLTQHATALWLTLIYALASNTWVISSQALWQHGMSELMLSLTVWLFLVAESSPAALIGAGLAAALAVANRPPNVIVVALLSLYILRRYHRLAWRFFLLPPFVAVAFLWYNLYYFNSLTGEFGIGPQLWTTPLRAGLVGLLVSPSRGLFVYTPWTLFSIWGIVQVWRSSREPLLFRYLTLGAIGEVLLYAKWVMWWGGGCFGPRFLTDILPILTILLLPILQPVWQRQFLRGLFAAAVGFAFVVQVFGAFCDIDIDQSDHSKLWTWKKSQLFTLLTSPSLAPKMSLTDMLRSIHKVLQTKQGRARDFGERLKTLLTDALQRWRAYHAGVVADCTGEAQRLRDALIHHLHDRCLTDPDNQRLLNHVRRYHDRGNLQRFLDAPGIEPTNNRAQLALRPAVIV